MSANSTTSRQKIPEIEGIRAIAITMVLAFHFFARWNTIIYPNDTFISQLEIVSYVSSFGYMGVELFFVTSGFVILGSLEHQASFTTFIKARLKRIYPSLLISVPIIYIVCNLLNQRFIAPIPVSSILPSLTLLGPDFLNYLFSTNFIWTTGVLWSLFIEIQFYLISGVIFFKLKKFTFLTKLFVFAISLQLLKIILSISNVNAKNALDALLPINNYIWWFLAGATFWRIMNSKNSKRLQFLVAVSIVFNLLTLNFKSLEFKFNPVASFIIVSIYVLFYFVTKHSIRVRFLKANILVWLGGVSYELYLIHESLGVSIISKINQSTMFQIGLPAYIILLVIVIGIMISLSAILKYFSSQILNMITKISNFLKQLYSNKL